VDNYAGDAQARRYSVDAATQSAPIGICWPSTRQLSAYRTPDIAATADAPEDAARPLLLAMPQRPERAFGKLSVALDSMVEQCQIGGR
jgi:hypothetical protein